VSIERTDVIGNENLVRAAEIAGVQRFVFVSVALYLQKGRVPLPRAKRRIEELLGRSSIRTTAVRPEMFQEVWLGPLVKLDWSSGKALVFGRGETPHAYVAVDDVAEAAVRVALADDPPAFIEFGGPEALSRHDVIRRFEELSGRSMKVRHIPRAVLRTGSRLLERVDPVQASLMGMAHAADVQTATLSADALHQLGIEPRPASAYIERIAQAG
jgi:NADH dehydrogenase